MKKYEVISFDMFQTLVDVNQRIPDIWMKILGEQYTVEKGSLGAKAIMENLAEAYEHALHPFCDMEQMFLECATNAVKQTGFAVTPKQIVDSLMYQHSQAPFYEETLEVLEKLSKAHTIILSSDASHIMVDPIIKRCGFERVFISDDLGCYKGDNSGAFFKKVLSEIGIAPEKVLHIGDSAADVLGANTVGMDSAWINRTGKEWTCSVKPTYEIKSLVELV